MPALTKSLFKKALLLCFLFSASVSDAEILDRTYTWSYHGKSFTNTFHFNSNTYYYYKKVKRNYDDFTYYMKENSNYKIIASVATSLKEIAKKNNYNEWQTVEFISAFVQHINYKDDGYYEYPRFPIETLVDKAGDCEDTAILLASILKYLGYKTVLISPKGHMGVGIAVKETLNGNAFITHGEKYYYIETTSTGWGIGDYPDHLSADAIVYDPGQSPNSRELSYYGNYDSELAQNSSSGNTTTNKQTHTNPTSQSSNKNTTAKSDENQNSETGYYSKPKSGEYQPSYVIEEDVIIVNGEKQTMTTKAVYNGDEFEVVAQEK